MARRPVFTISNESPFYNEENIDFTFYSGFAEVQKKKSIKSLHEAFLKNNPTRRILEVSSKSENELGVKLSAFNLTIETKLKKSYSVEVIFQASKAFQNGGPYRDILEMTSREAKKDTRLKNSGKLTHFDFFGKRFGLTPTTFFYNWLYINALNINLDLANELLIYDSFTDIEFNPDRSINCQARAAAVYVSLRKQGILEKSLENEDVFLEVVYGKEENTNIIIEQLSLWDKL